MRMKHSAGLLGIFLMMASSSTVLQEVDEKGIFTPDFSSFEIQERKLQFAAFIKTLVEKENKAILERRKRLKSLCKNLERGLEIETSDVEWLSQLATQYKVNDFDYKNLNHLERLISKIDIVPIELAVAQSANESGWGTSRFAAQGANFFGQWCYQKGCGLVPKQKKDGLHYEVRKFEAPQLSVKAYIHNLNVHPAFSKFRSLRRQMRKNNGTLSAQELATGLVHYSERGQAYIRDLKKLIRSNQSILLGI